jgi:hypothetical protein
MFFGGTFERGEIGGRRRLIEAALSDYPIYEPPYRQSANAPMYDPPADIFRRCTNNEIAIRKKIKNHRTRPDALVGTVRQWASL